jgi:REP element-mobilizing transposase RayT
MIFIMQRDPARKKIRLPSVVYMSKRTASVTIGTHVRHRWFSLFPEFSDRVVEILHKSVLDSDIRLFAWCLMPDHVHLLVECENLVGFVRSFKGRATAAARAVDSDHRLWQRSFYDHLLRTDEDVRTVARYIWENPVRAGIVRKPAEYRWSGSAVWHDWRAFFG